MKKFLIGLLLFVLSPILILVLLITMCFSSVVLEIAWALCGNVILFGLIVTAVVLLIKYAFDNKKSKKH